MIVSCSKETVDENLPLAEQLIEENGVSYVDENSVPFLRREMNILLNGKEKTSKSYFLNREKVMVVKGDKGKKTYSYQLFLQNSSPNIFYNLSIDEDKILRIFEYEVDPDHLENFIISNFDLKKFKGRISLYDGQQFLESQGNNEKRFVSPCDSEEIGQTEGTLESGGTGGGSTGTDGDYQEPIGGTGTSGGGDSGGGGYFRCDWEVIGEEAACEGPVSYLVTIIPDLTVIKNTNQ